MSTPRVSVITRTFNRKDMLRRALESVLAQTWTNKESVVVNDGGEDVEDVVQEFRDRGLEIVHLGFPRERKPGRCLAATRGIEASSGDYVTYLDDDDIYFPTHLETLMKAALDTGALVLYTDAMVGQEVPDGRGGYAVTNTWPGASEEFSRAGFYASMYIHLVTFCHHRRVFDQLGGFDPELSVLEDLDLMFRYSADYNFHHVKQFTAQYHLRTDDTNAVTSMRREFKETREQLCKRYLHVAVNDMMSFINEGRARLIGLHDLVLSMRDRLEALERRVDGLDKERA